MEAILEYMRPSTRVVFGGFSQGAAAALAGAVAMKEEGKAPDGLVLLMPGTPPVMPPKASLSGAAVFMAVGAEDQVAPPEGGEALFRACEEAGAKTEPLLRHSRGHEVTVEVGDALVSFLNALMDD